MVASDTVIRSSQPRPLLAYLNPLAMVAGLWSNREIAWQLAKREVAVRYKSSYLGIVWSILTPLAMLVVYTFAFAIVLHARWGDDANESRVEYALTMFCGLLLFNLFSEVVGRGPYLVVSTPNLVKKAVFPLEVLTVTALLSALVNMLIGYGVWLVGWVLLEHSLPHWTLVWFPVLLLPVCLTTLGVAWVLASVGVFLRDLGHAVQIVITMLFFATPIFYSIDRVPMPYRRLLELNPLSHAIEDVRGALMWGQSPDWRWWAFSMGVGIVLAVFGYAFFMKSRRAFGDVV